MTNLSSRRTDFAGGPIQRIPVARAEMNIHALPRKTMRDRAADCADQLGRYSSLQVSLTDPLAISRSISVSE